MSRPQETKNGPDAVSPNSRIGAVAPAATNEQGHRNSMSDSTVNGTPTGDATVTNITVATSTVRAQAADLLLSGDLLAREIFQWGFRVGEGRTVDRFHDRAAHITDEFLSYLAEEPEAIPGEIPPLQHAPRTLGVAA